jgi:hypothetical protein
MFKLQRLALGELCILERASCAANMPKDPTNKKKTPNSNHTKKAVWMGKASGSLREIMNSV